METKVEKKHQRNRMQSRKTVLSNSFVHFSPVTQCRRRSPNGAVNCRSSMELRPPTARKSHPNFFVHCKGSTKMKKVPKSYHPKRAKHHENASRPNGFKLWRIINKMMYFNFKTPCKRMIHVCLRKIFLLLQSASNSNVQSIKSTSKKCHLLVQNTR